MTYQYETIIEYLKPDEKEIERGYTFDEKIMDFCPAILVKSKWHIRLYWIRPNGEVISRTILALTKEKPT